MRVRSDFLKWQPDQDDFNNPGLTIADNVLHDTEGYKQLLQQTDAAFTTTTVLGGSATVQAVNIRPAGVGANRFICAINPLPTTAAMVNFAIGDQDTGDGFTNVASATLVSANAAVIKSFSTADTPTGILVTAQMLATLVASTTTYSLTVLAEPT